MYFVEVLEDEVDEDLLEEVADQLVYLHENLPLPENVSVRWVRGFRRKDDGFETFCRTFDLAGDDTMHCRGTKDLLGWVGSLHQTTIFLRAEPDLYDDNNSVWEVVAHEAIHVLQYAEGRMSNYKENKEALEQEADFWAWTIEDARLEGLSVEEYLCEMDDYETD